MAVMEVRRALPADHSFTPTPSPPVAHESAQPAPHPLAVLQLGAERLRSGHSDPLAAASPNYICASAAEENAATGRAVTGGS